jgi:hypothetical protein
MLYRPFLALLLFFSLNLSVSAEGYWITVEELDKLEESLLTAQNELRISQAELSTLKEITTRQDERLTALVTLSTEQVTQLTKVSGLFETYASAARLTQAALIVALAISSGLALGFAFK